MFIDSCSLLDPSLQPSEMQCFHVLNYQYIALHWSAKQLWRRESINIWLLWSQSTMVFTFDPLTILFSATGSNLFEDCLNQ
jgi:hypothetical protein